MAKRKTDDELPAQFVLCEEMMASWFEGVLAMTDQYFRFWLYPFSAPQSDEVEQSVDLDMPGPLERDHEHNLFA